MSNRHAVLTSILVVSLLLPGIAQAQKKPSATIVPAEKLPEGWEEIDQRLLFLMVRLANVEASLDAIEKAIGSGTRKKVAKTGEGKRAEAGNDKMDRKGGGPMKWSEFYGTTAEAFFYHPTDRNTTYHTTTVLSQQGPQADNKVGGGVPAGQGVPVHQRPPQFDYIYRANSNAKERAEAEAAALKGKIEELAERRNRLETEQSGLWCEIAFRAVSHYDLDQKPLYRFEPLPTGSDMDSQLHAESMKGAASFMALALSIVDAAQKDQATTFSKIKPAVSEARQKLNDGWLQLGIDATDRYTTEGKFAALAKRLDDVASNLSDSYVVANEGEQAHDQQRKDTFRAMLQQSLVSYAQIILALDEMSAVMKNDWKIKPDVKRPIQFVSLANVVGVPVAASLSSRPTARPAPSSDKQGTTVDLLKLAKVDEDTVGGKWTRNGGVLITGDDRVCKLRLPLPDNEAYRLEIEAKRTRGDTGFFVNIPSFGYFSAIELDKGPSDSKYSGLAKIDGQHVPENGTRKPGALFTTGKLSTIVIVVKANHISTTVDGRTVVDWHGDPSLLSNPGNDPRGVGLGSWTGEGRTYVVSKISLTHLDGGAIEHKPPVNKNSDENEIQGEWLGVAAEVSGKSKDESEVKQQNRRLSIKGRSLTMERTLDGIRGAYAGKFDINSSTGHFDFVGKGPDGNLVEWIGIYDLNGGSLRLCFRTKINDDVQRPMKFEPEDGVLLFTFKLTNAPLLATSKRGNAINEPLSSLKGTWLAATEEVGGKPIPKEEMLKKRKTLKIDRNEFTLSTTYYKIVGKAALVSDEGPDAIDLSGTYVEGGNGQAIVLRGRFDIKKRTLRLCYSLNDDMRPTEFETEEGKPGLCVTFERND
jgi:uncharacterized protein (TIGR03067 family)